MEMNETDNLQTVPDKKLVWFIRMIIFFCALNLLLRLVSSYFPEERLWGVNHLVYFSSYFAFAITILGLLILVPRVNYWLRDILKKPINFIYKLTIQKHKYLYFVVFSLLSVVLFWFLRVKIPYLGDGFHLTTEFTTRKIILTWEPLEIATRLYLYKLLNQFTLASPATIYALVSYLAGTIFIFFAILTADLLGKNKFEKVFTFSILVSMGSILLFFGYAENYSLSYATMLAYLYFSLKYLKKESSILPATLTFVLGCFLHLVTFLLFPSLLFLYLLKADANTEELHISKKKIFLFLPVVLLVAVGIYVYVKTHSNPKFLAGISVPLSPTWYGMPYYTLFSSSHLLDMLNEHLLISPIGLIFVSSIVVIFGLSKIGFKDRIVQFFMIVIVFQLAFHFLVDPKLGAIRDWDLFSFTALGYTLLGIYLLLKLVQDEKRIRYIGTILIFTSIFSTLSWIMVNANTERSLKRIVNIVRLDPARNFKFYIYVEEYLDKIGWPDTEESKKLDELFRVNFPVAWFQRKGEEQVKAGNFEEAETIYQEAVRVAPWRPSTHYGLGVFYLERRKFDLAISELEKAIQLDPQDIIAFNSYGQLGYIYLLKGQLDKAIEMYNKAIRGEIDNKESAYQNLGHCYLLKNDLDKAMLAYQEALKLNPNFVEPHIYLGHSYLKKGMKDKAIKEYEIYLKYGKDDNQIKVIKTLMSKLNSK